MLKHVWSIFLLDNNKDWPMYIDFDRERGREIDRQRHREREDHYMAGKIGRKINININSPEYRVSRCSLDGLCIKCTVQKWYPTYSSWQVNMMSQSRKWRWGRWYDKCNILVHVVIRYDVVNLIVRFKSSNQSRYPYMTTLLRSCHEKSGF